MHGFFFAFNAEPDGIPVRLEDWFPSGFVDDLSDVVAAQTLNSDSDLFLAGAGKGSFVLRVHGIAVYCSLLPVHLQQNEGGNSEI